jgi:hypothetical protein
MSTRAELAAELHALAAYLSVDRPDALARVCDGTSGLVMRRMDVIARSLAEESERGPGPARQCSERRDGMRCTLIEEHFGEHDFTPVPLSTR